MNELCFCPGTLLGDGQPWRTLQHHVLRSKRRSRRLSPHWRDLRRGLLSSMLILPDGRYSRWKAAALPPGLGIEMPKDFDQRRHQPGPSGLMAGADACAVVAVEIFVEQKIVPPIRVALELLGRRRTPAACNSRREGKCGSADWRSRGRPRTGSSSCLSRSGSRS